uniref:Zgc:66484 n=1 Tax=Latimeria chalumnae TaxID=7897 RepID=H3B1U2_LATCH
IFLQFHRVMASGSAPSDPQVIIIGAGFSGLAAASTLVERGRKNVLVLEAMDRLGGRVYTVRPFGDDTIELGANWIHGQQGNPLYQLAKEQGLLAEEELHIAMCSPGCVTLQDYFFNEHGKQLETETAEKVCAYFGSLMRKAFDKDFDLKYSSWNLGDFLDQEFWSSGLSDFTDASRIFEWCKRSECTDEASSSLYDFSLSQLGTYKLLEGGVYNCLGPGGYQAILDILQRTLPLNTVLYNKPVRCIHWLDSPRTGSTSLTHPVRVVCEDGSEFLADHVIVTVSLGYLQDNALTLFDPQLPSRKLKAIARLGFGIVSKIFLEFDYRFWPEDCSGIQLLWDEGLEDKKHGEDWKKVWHKKICGFDEVARHDRVLCGWITGREAEYMENLDEKEVGEVCVRLLRDFTGWKVPSPRRVLRSTWWKNPYIRGSYTYIPVGIDAVKEQEILVEPLPSTQGGEPLQVLFAGEATHSQYYTTTHGAYLSGIREAERILRHY